MSWVEPSLHPPGRGARAVERRDVRRDLLRFLLRLDPWTKRFARGVGRTTSSVGPVWSLAAVGLVDRPWWRPL